MTTERQGGKTILVVEDDAPTREALAMILAAEGFAAVGAANGQEALSRLRGDIHADLILLDLMMPIMDGWQFRREQARDPALADGNVNQKAAALRSAGYLQKPVDPEELLQVIRRQFPG